MRRWLFGLVVLGSSAGLAFGQRVPGIAATQAPVPAGFAVLELFTSEGCSSCPPADRVLSAIAAERAGAPVLALSFHVDYWNSLGWRDPFSAAAHSRRQRRHAKALGHSRVYTPQLVVNGQAEVLGSSASAVRALVARVLAAPTIRGPRIELAARERGAVIEVRHRITQAPPDATLSLLVVQRKARNQVTRGENASLTLAHTNVVRSLTLVPMGKRSTVRPPDELAGRDVFVDALLEAVGTQVILAVARADVRERDGGEGALQSDTLELTE